LTRDLEDSHPKLNCKRLKCELTDLREFIESVEPLPSEKRLPKSPLEKSYRIRFKVPFPKKLQVIWLYNQSFTSLSRIGIMRVKDIAL
jgi:hypothetical protein